MSVLINVTTGKENFSDFGSSQIFAFYLDRRNQQSIREVHLYKAVEENLVSYLSPPNKMSASRNRAFRSIAGFWSMANYRVPEDTFIKIFATQHISRGRAMRISKGNLMLHVSNTYPSKKIEIDLVGSPDSVIEKAVIEGRFVIMTQEELGGVLPEYIRLFPYVNIDPIHLQDILEVINIEASTEARPVSTVKKAVNIHGKEVEVRVNEKRRLFRLRKGD